MKMAQLHCEASEFAEILKASSQSFDMINNTARSIFAEPQRTFLKFALDCTANELHKKSEMFFLIKLIFLHRRVVHDSLSSRFLDN